VNLMFNHSWPVLPDTQAIANKALIDEYEHGLEREDFPDYDGEDYGREEPVAAAGAARPATDPGPAPVAQEPAAGARVGVAQGPAVQAAAAAADPPLTAAEVAQVYFVQKMKEAAEKVQSANGDDSHLSPCTRDMYRMMYPAV
jgi:hypothetical protein